MLAPCVNGAASPCSWVSSLGEASKQPTSTHSNRAREHSCTSKKRSLYKQRAPYKGFAWDSEPEKRGKRLPQKSHRGSDSVTPRGTQDWSSFSICSLTGWEDGLSGQPFSGQVFAGHVCDCLCPWLNPNIIAKECHAHDIRALTSPATATRLERPRTVGPEQTKQLALQQHKTMQH